MAESMRTSDALRMVANEARQGEWERAVCLDGAKYMERMERELTAYRTAEEQGLLIRLPCKVGGDIYWINDEEKCVSVHKNGIRGIVVRNGEFAIEDTDGYIDVAGTKYCYLTRAEAEKALEGQK